VSIPFPTTHSVWTRDAIVSNRFRIRNRTPMLTVNVPSSALQLYQNAISIRHHCLSIAAFIDGDKSKHVIVSNEFRVRNRAAVSPSNVSSSASCLVITVHQPHMPSQLVIPPSEIASNFRTRTPKSTKELWAIVQGWRRNVIICRLDQSCISYFTQIALILTSCCLSSGKTKYISISFEVYMLSRPVSLSTRLRNKTLRLTGLT
jgi:hypothetical protein